MTNPVTKQWRARQRELFILHGRPARMIGVPAGINRHTNKPHEHKREIARRMGRAK